MLRVKDEEFSLRERRDNSHHRQRRYSEDYDSEADLYQKYKAAGLDDNMVAEQSMWHVKTRWTSAAAFLSSILCKYFFFSPLNQMWASDDDDEPLFSPVMRKKAVKVKHVKRREKKFEKKVRFVSSHKLPILFEVKCS